MQWKIDSTKYEVHKHLFKTILRVVASKYSEIKKKGLKIIWVLIKAKKEIITLSEDKLYLWKSVTKREDTEYPEAIYEIMQHELNHSSVFLICIHDLKIYRAL